MRSQRSHHLSHLTSDFSPLVHQPPGPRINVSAGAAVHRRTGIVIAGDNHAGLHGLIADGLIALHTAGGADHAAGAACAKRACFILLIHHRAAGLRHRCGIFLGAEGFTLGMTGVISLGEAEARGTACALVVIAAARFRQRQVGTSGDTSSEQHDRDAEGEF